MFFLFFSLIIVILVLSLKFSKLQFEIKDFTAVLSSKEALLNTKYKLFIRIYILGIIKVLDKQIKHEDFKNKKRFKKLQDRIKNNGQKRNLKILSFKNIKNLNIRVKKSDLNIKIDTENAALTAILTGIIYTIVPNFINYFLNLGNDIQYKIEPIYQNKNEVSLFFDGIFEIDLIHIINTYKVLIGKDKEEKNNGTSNRKSYAYNNG